MNGENKIKILVGMGTCGLAVGAQSIYDEIKKCTEKLNIDADAIAVGCVGYCCKEVIVDIIKPGFPKLSYGEVTPEKIEELLKSVILDGKNNNELILGKYKTETEINREDLAEISYIEDLPFFKKQKRLVLKNCGLINPLSPDEYIENNGYKGLKKAFSLSPEEVTEEVKKSGLRGRGGGGFPTGTKWTFARNAKAEKKYIICNADEGDPGAFMDRSVLEGDPFAVIEGMTVAAYAIGANHGYIYARAEYPLAIKNVEYAIKVAKERNLLGDNILGSGFNFNLKVKKGAGAFVCGEETALIASIEGKRGMPKPRPPFPAVKGLFGYPTVINNVETLANIPNILRNGGEQYAEIGTENSKGTKVFALTGNITNTGLVEVPMGITLREVIYDIGGGIADGKKYKSVQIGGPSGGCIPEQHLDIKIDYESLKEVGAMMGSGGLVVMDETTCMVDVAKFFLEFITKESCGKCIPCREGTMRMYEILERITTSYENLSEQENLERFRGVIYLNRLAEVIRDTSLCGLGQTAPNPVLSTLRYFKDEYDAHIYDRKCPAGHCKSLMKYSVNTETCIGCGLCKKKCPADAIAGEPKKAHYIISDKCIQCDQCRQICPVKAISAE